MEPYPCLLTKYGHKEVAVVDQVAAIPRVGCSISSSAMPCYRQNFKAVSEKLARSSMPRKRLPAGPDHARMIQQEKEEARYKILY